MIKELPTLVPADEKLKSQTTVQNESAPQNDFGSTNDSQTNAGLSQKQEQIPKPAVSNPVETKPLDQRVTMKAMGKSPGEIAFFKLLHSEFKKSCFFFKQAEDELAIREARVQEGNEIMQRPNSIMVNDKWSLLSKSLYRLYKDLLLLETYAIMSYVTFSKILKKHDKMTGFTTRQAFMTNVVSQANFTTYPRLIAMITRTEALHEEVSRRLVQDGKDRLYEDERLFINMIHRLNNQALENEDGPLKRRRKINEKETSNVSNENLDSTTVPTPNLTSSVGAAASSLQTLVEANDVDEKKHGETVSVDIGSSSDSRNQNSSESKKRGQESNESSEKRPRL